MTEKLDFNELLRRGNDRFAQKDKLPPSELFQCVVFYGKPVKEELFENGQDFKPKRKWWGPWKDDYQSIMAINEFLDAQRFVYPFYSKEIFMSQQEATNFLPLFIKRLIKEEKIPANAIKEDRSVDEEVVKLGVAPLMITILEEVKDEFRGANHL